MINLMQGDCLERMKEIESGSVDMILTDPPYGTVKGVADGNVNHGMKGKTSWDEIINHKEMLSECNRVLRTNGALVLFSQDPYTAKLMAETHGNLPFSYRLTWLKDHFANSLIAKKAPVNYTEDICVFFKKEYDKWSHPLNKYADQILMELGLTAKQVNNLIKNGNSRFFRVGAPEFRAPSESLYRKLIEVIGIDKLDCFIDYQQVRVVDSEFKLSIPKTFNLPEGKKYKSNVLQYKKDYTGLHPTQKPVALLEDLIKTYSNEGNTILDFTMGSGSTGVAAKNLNRKFIGTELDEGYFNIAKERINNA
jgi:DNA modification methylase